MRRCHASNAGGCPAGNDTTGRALKSSVLNGGAAAPGPVLGGASQGRSSAINRSFEQQKTEFELLVHNLPLDGLIIYNADDSDFKALVYGREVVSFSYGIDNDADFLARDIDYQSKTTFTVDEKKIW